MQAASPEDAYWKAVGQILAQLDGITGGHRGCGSHACHRRVLTALACGGAAGYAASSPPAGEVLTAMDFLVMNLDGDMETLQNAVNGQMTEGQVTSEAT